MRKISQIRQLILNTLEEEYRESLLFVTNVSFWLIDIQLKDAKDKYNWLLLSSYALPTLTANLLNIGTFMWCFFDILLIYLGQVSNNVDLMQ